MAEEKSSRTFRCARCGNDVDIPADVESLVNALGQPLCPGCFALWHQTQRIQEPPEILVRQSKYQFTDDMDEISGFGGGYEQTCRNMLAAGVEWLDAHPSADPQFQGYENIYGVIHEENADAKALSEAIVKATDHDCTGAMHQTVITHCLFIRQNGWEEYCKIKKKERGP